jgi:lipopolysaccharide export LptBFGC system permease protein LptF
MSSDMTKCQLLIVLGLLFFFIGMGLNASDDEHRSDTGTAIFFWILSVPMFIGAWKTKDK